MSRTQSVNSKFISISRRSGEVTAQLSTIEGPSAKEAYERIQLVEATTVAAAMKQTTAQAAAREAAMHLDQVRRHVRLLNAACVNICAIRGIVSPEYFTIVDQGDEGGLGGRLEPEIRRVPDYGPALADALAHLLRDLSAAEAASVKAKAAHTIAARELDSAILTLGGVVAQGLAVLATFGVKLPRKTSKKKPESTPSQPTAQPALVATAA